MKYVCGKFPEKVFCDEERVKQVVLNLLQNALKYTLRGNITVKLEYVSDEEEGKIRISVSDTGIGIKDIDKKKIFKLFGKLDDSSNTSGIGIGLHFCKKIVEAIGGQISLNDNVSQGTTFTITIQC